MLMRSTIVYGAVAIVVLCVPAFGTVNYTAQVRRTYAGTESQEVSEQANNFLPFDSEVWAYGFGDNAHASQHSALAPDRMFASGVSSARGGVQIFGGTSETVFDVSFNIDASTSFTFLGSCNTALGASPGNASVSFSGPSGLIYGWNGSPQLNNWDFSGILAPGSYHLNLTASTAAFGSMATSEVAYSLVLLVPSPGGSALLVASALLGMRRKRH